MIDRFGEKIDTEPAPSLSREDGLPTVSKFDTTAHNRDCRNGWLGTDPDGRMIPCLKCRPHLRQDQLPGEVVKTGRSTSARSTADCTRCDSRGYFGTTVCDHNPDRIEINRRGKALVDAALAEAKRKAG